MSQYRQRFKIKQYVADFLPPYPSQKDGVTDLLKTQNSLSLKKL
jgi:hypothetical protein